jgi:hypothetical protein
MYHFTSFFPKLTAQLHLKTFLISQSLTLYSVILQKHVASTLLLAVTLHAICAFGFGF